jgi:hypothetical protein
MVGLIPESRRLVAVLVGALERVQGKEQERLGKAILEERLRILPNMAVAVAAAQVQSGVTVHPTHPEMVEQECVQL